MEYGLFQFEILVVQKKTPVTKRHEILATCPHSGIHNCYKIRNSVLIEKEVNYLILTASGAARNIDISDLKYPP